MNTDDELLVDEARQQITERLLEACWAAGYTQITVQEGAAIMARYNTEPEPEVCRDGVMGYVRLRGVLRRFTGGAMSNSGASGGYHFAQPDIRPKFIVGTYERPTPTGDTR